MDKINLSGINSINTNLVLLLRINNPEELKNNKTIENKTIENKIQNTKLSSHMETSFGSIYSNVKKNKNLSNTHSDEEEFDNFVRKYIKYDDNNRWPKNTNLRCWHCTLCFDTIPCAIPYQLVGDVFYVFGCFCSFNCALSYVLNSRKSDKLEMISLINLMYKKMFNCTKEIVPSPPKEILKEYGGFLSQKEYRSHINDTNINYKLLFPPIISTGYNYDKVIHNNELKNKEVINFKKLDSVVAEATQKKQSSSLINKFIQIK